MPDLVDEWLQETTPIETEEVDLVGKWLEETAEPKPWWEVGREKTKDIYQWFYPQGIEDLPRQWGATLTEAGMKTGEAATWLARFCPAQEDLPSYKEQSSARQALTLAQATSLIALAGLIGYTGISAIGSLAKNLAYGRADKIADKFATQHLAKIKTLNPQVRTLEDAKALTEASLRGIVSPRVETTYLPTVMAELKTLGIRLLKPLAETTPTANFKSQLTSQVSNLFKQVSGKAVTEEIMLPFIQTIEHYVGNPVSGMITAEYGKAVAAILSDKILPMFEQIRQVGKAVPAIEEPMLTPEERIVEREEARLLTPTPEEYAAPEVAPKAEEIYRKEVLAEITEEEKSILQMVKEKGGIKYTESIKDHGEFKEILLSAKSKTGLSLDEMAGELGMTEDDLWEALTKAPTEAPMLMERELTSGGGPALGLGIELTDKKPGEDIFAKPKEKGPFDKFVDDTIKTFSVYHNVKKEYPEAYQMFREFKGGQELARITAEQKNKEIWGKITQNEALAIQRHRQNPEKYPLEKLAEKLRPIAQKLDKAMEGSLAEFVAMGKMKVGWPQSYIELLEKEKEKLVDKISVLKQPKAIQRRQDRVKEIDELVELLKSRRFFPGRYYDTPEGQAALLKFLPQGKFRTSQIREVWIKGKTISDIDVAIKTGLEPIDPRAATMDYLYWKEMEKNKWVLYQGFKSNPNLVMKEKDAPEWWDDATGLKELKGYKINPIISDVLREFEWTDPKGLLEQAVWKTVRVGKIASFYNPLIMGGIYDPQQGYMAAGISVLNPILFAESIKSAVTKDDFYKMSVQADLFPKPVDLGPQRDMDKLAISVARQMDKDTPKFVELIEKWTDGQWNFKDDTNIQKMIKTFKGFYSGLWNTTWMLDAASRMNTVKVLIARGWDFKKAVERARFYHADYGDIPAGTRRIANYAMWTPSYQASMAKVYGNMARHPVKERGPLSRLVAFQLIAATAMAMLGYKWVRGNRFVKDISKTEEDVIASPGPLYWLNKTAARNPIWSAYWMSSVPVNIFLSIYKNYDGLGGRVFDPKASKLMQLAQTAEFVIGRYFRPLEAARRLRDEERKLLDRLLQLVAITKYQRKKPAKPKREKYWWR